MFDQLVLADQPALIFDEIVKNVEGFRSKPELCVALKKRSASHVEPELIERKDLVCKFLHKELSYPCSQNKFALWKLLDRRES
jgi:hypothetical protein